ncbi:hypothetical protein K7I13_01965 [Brucepastera parasyntrophica]|uniref:tocopherol cyclase family protein n=1 Tax=Brucepastera parasyntrophica TaxID=2880008 RepID=UPI00210951D6|nr:tocopherol cyclase family protein [Brucepastera parasyntrophica]ULQ60115.1 hypothetical protein K7I13_01965 [Brucepastera parasyntrophica]
MKTHNIPKKNKDFFEGWFFKHQNNEQGIAFIPGINITKEGEKKVFIQIITNTESFNVDYDANDFSVDKKDLFVKIGNSIFSDSGIKIDINTPEVICTGELNYGPITPINYNIMGPFSVFRNMECNHGVISMHHSVNGTLTLNGTVFSFENANGYIEKDWGYSFPETYTWLQCNDDCSIMVSIATIPFFGLFFQGLISVIRYKNKEYRIATYNGGKVIYNNEKGLMIKKGTYTLKAEFSDTVSHPLKAPDSGNMSRIIRESISCKVNFEFARGKTLLFTAENRIAGYERA